MKEINPNQIQKTVQGIKKPVSKEVKNMDETINKFLAELKTSVMEKIKKHEDFETVYVDFTNPDKTLIATDFMLKITKPFKNVKGKENVTNLELVAYKLPMPYKAQCILSTGSESEILELLETADLPKRIKTRAASLSRSLEDV